MVVAVAVVFDSHGRVLWGCRPKGKPYEGYWEFPGGKVESGESVWHALQRELQEELGIKALAGAPWFRIEHDYEHANVRLHLYRVWSFIGQPVALEDQSFCWAPLLADSLDPILPATAPLLPVMNQPEVMLITQCQSIGLDNQMQRLHEALERAGEGKLRVQFRENELPEAHLLEAYRAIVQWGESNQVMVNVNSTTALRMLRLGLPQSELVKLHLTEAHLLSRPDCLMANESEGASVHNESALEKVFSEGLRYATLGAVKETASHPGQKGLGWLAFTKIATKARLPVYAIGGLGWSDLASAQVAGAHGIAGITGL